jgi:hypothetical protein
MSNSNKIDSVVVDNEMIKKPSFFSNTANKGLGIDLGAVYQLTDKISLSASITDLGFINWKSNVTNLQASSTFKFSGFNITDVVNGSKTIDQLAQEMVDSLKNSFSINKDTQGFRTYLPTGISVGGSFNLTKSLALGILSHTVLVGKQIREALSVSANLNLGDAFSTSISYSAENSNYNNLGAGLAFRFGLLQFYFITDKIPISWNKIVTTNGSIPLPANWNNLNFRFGMNLAFGNKIKKKNDKPMLTEQKK